jgi:hypothetical protein
MLLPRYKDYRVRDNVKSELLGGNSPDKKKGRRGGPYLAA